MAERTELLDAAIQAILDGATEVAIPRELEPLVAIAADLRDLPRPEFKRRLGGRMTTTVTTQIHDVIPYLVTEDVDGLVDFVKKVFRAEEVFRTQAPSGTHCEVRLGGRRFMIGGGAPGRSTLGEIHVFVPDVDAAYQRAVDAGVTFQRAPVDQFYGSRDASVIDRFGNKWFIATAIEDRGDLPDMLPCFHPVGGGRFLEFLEGALGGEVTERHDKPDGSLLYATVRLGRAIAEVGEASEQWQPTPMMLMVLVDDADAAYAHAVAAGAKPLHEPSDAPYGRVGAVEDAMGNQWYLTTEKA